MSSPLAVEKLEKKVRYKNVTVIPVGNEKFPTMVQIDKAPARVKDLIGKKYINPQKAQAVIEAVMAVDFINKGSKKVKAELGSIGIVETAW